MVETCRRLLAQESNSKWFSRIMAGKYDDTFSMRLVQVAYRKGREDERRAITDATSSDSDKPE